MTWIHINCRGACGERNSFNHIKENTGTPVFQDAPRQGHHSTLSSHWPFLLCFFSPQNTPTPKTSLILQVFPHLYLEQGDRVIICFWLKTKPQEPLWEWESKERKGLILWGKTEVSRVATSLNFQPRHHLTKSAPPPPARLLHRPGKSLDPKLVPRQPSFLSRSTYTFKSDSTPVKKKYWPFKESNWEDLCLLPHPQKPHSRFKE